MRALATTSLRCTLGLALVVGFSVSSAWASEEEEDNRTLAILVQDTRTTPKPPRRRALKLVTETAKEVVGWSVAEPRGRQKPKARRVASKCTPPASSACCLELVYVTPAAYVLTVHLSDETEPMVAVAVVDIEQERQISTRQSLIDKKTWKTTLTELVVEVLGEAIYGAEVIPAPVATADTTADGDSTGEGDPTSEPETVDGAEDEAESATAEATPPAGEPVDDQAPASDTEATGTEVASTATDEASTDTAGDTSGEQAGEPTGGEPEVIEASAADAQPGSPPGATVVTSPAAEDEPTNRIFVIAATGAVVTVFEDLAAGQPGVMAGLDLDLHPIPGVGLAVLAAGQFSLYRQAYPVYGGLAGGAVPTVDERRIHTLFALGYDFFYGPDSPLMLELGAGLSLDFFASGAFSNSMHGPAGYARFGYEANDVLGLCVGASYAYGLFGTVDSLTVAGKPTSRVDWHVALLFRFGRAWRLGISYDANLTTFETRYRQQHGIGLALEMTIP